MVGRRSFTFGMVTFRTVKLWGVLRVLGFNATSFQEIAVLWGDDGGQSFFLVGQLFLGGDWHGQGIRLDLHDISCLTAIYTNSGDPYHDSQLENHHKNSRNCVQRWTRKFDLVYNIFDPKRGKSTLPKTYRKWVGKGRLSGFPFWNRKFLFSGANFRAVNVF